MGSPPLGLCCLGCWLWGSGWCLGPKGAVEGKVKVTCDRVDFFWGLSLFSDGPPILYICLLITFLCKNTKYIWLGASQMTLFYLNYLFKGPTSKCNHILKHWRLELQHRYFPHNIWYRYIKNYQFLPKIYV